MAKEILEDIYKQLVFDSYFHFINWLNKQFNNGKKPVFRFDGFERTKDYTHIIITVRKETIL